MNEREIIGKVAKNLDYQRKFIARWISDKNNERRTYAEERDDILLKFVEDGKIQKKLVPSALRFISTWHMFNAMNSNIIEGRFPDERISLGALYTFWHQQCAHAIMESDDPAGYTLIYRDFIPVCTMLTLGWSNHAVRMAETLFDRWDVQKDGNGAVPWETFGEHMPWVAIKLYKAWRDSDEECEFEPEVEQLEGYAPLLETLLDPRPRVFGDALEKAADFHVMGTGLDDHDPVKKEDYWFFPVELLAACRIRELRGLETPHVAHPLFDATPLGRLHERLPVPRDELLEKVLPLYAKVTGKLDLKV